MKLFPVEIFLIIQQYLGNDKEYRMLMNCNKAIFQSIKFQTVYFLKKIDFEEEEEESIESFDEKLENFPILISRVKDKSKQIGLSLSYIPTEFVMLYAQVFHQIHRISITYQLTDELNFNIFNNIYHVELKHLGNITIINSGFENVRILTIALAPNLTTIDLSHANLYEFKLIACLKITILKGINNTRCLETGGIRNPEGFQLLPNIPYESISMNAFNVSLDVFYRLDYSHLHTLSLYELSVSEGGDLSIFQNIPDLSLRMNAMVPRDNYPSLPVFYGKYLHLFCFNLQLWTSPDFIPNVCRIKLLECTNLDPSLSFLSKVRVISLCKCPNIEKFVSLPCCTQLELISMDTLEIIEVQPRLRELKATCCPKLLDYGNDGQLLKRVEIYMCPNFISLNRFRNSQEVIVHSNQSIDLSDLDQSHCLFSDRIIRIFLYYSDSSVLPIRCEGLANLHFLTLMVNGESHTLSHFHDIHTLLIKGSYRNIKEVSHLRNIHVLKFTGVSGIDSLHHLENIDKIMLCPFPADFQFDGLKGCRVVYSRWNKRLEEQAELYGRGERDVSLFDGNYLEMFGSIEEFYIVHEGAYEWEKVQESDLIRLW